MQATLGRLDAWTLGRLDAWTLGRLACIPWTAREADTLRQIFLRFRGWADVRYRRGPGNLDQ